MVGGGACIHLDQDWDKWQSVTKAIINIYVPSKAGNFLSAQE